jgi:hypothetical protein
MFCRVSFVIAHHHHNGQRCMLATWHLSFRIGYILDLPKYIELHTFWTYKNIYFCIPMKGTQRYSIKSESTGKASERCNLMASVVCFHDVEPSWSHLSKTTYLLSLLLFSNGQRTKWTTEKACVLLESQ